MPKRSPHPYVSWRDGRPRFQPDQILRAAGHKGKDLRHDDGSWFSFEEACAWGTEFQSKLRALQGPPPRPLKSRRGANLRGPSPWQLGYVYFLWAGDAIKIGFSTAPFARVGGLMTGVAAPISFFVTVPGSRADEAELHKRLAGARIRGEWFRPTLSVIRTIQRASADALGPLAKVEKLTLRAEPLPHAE